MKRFDGRLAFDIRVNLRWVLRPVCAVGGGHDWQEVISIHPLMGEGFHYCKRCGQGWRTGGLEHTQRFCRHRWEDDGGPSVTVSTGEPFRQLQRCPRCGKRRCIECATGNVVV